MTDAPPKKRRRRLLLIAAAAVAVLLIATVAVLATLDVERLRGPLETALADATGWDAELGAIDYSLLDGLVVRVQPAKLTERGGDGRVEIEEIHVSARPWSLLGGTLRVNDITLVQPSLRFIRESREAGWSTPMPSGERARPTPPAGTDETNPEVPAGDPKSGGGMSVSIDRVVIVDGRATLEDRTSAPARTFALENIGARIQPTATRIELEAELPDGGGSFRGDGDWTDALQLTVSGLRTEALHPFLGEEMLRGGGRVDGTIAFTPPLSLTGDLEASDVLLLAGEQALPRADIAFEVRGDGSGPLDLQSLTLTAGETRITGKGRLQPALDLDMQLHEAPIEAVVGAARAVFPFPLEFRSPGSGRADIQLDQPAGGVMTYRVDGALTAAGYRAAEFLPEAENIAADFSLSRAGKLTVDLTGGDVAGGPLRGRAMLDSVQPVGKLTFDGGLQQTPLGALLAGFIGDRAAAITGPSMLDADLGLDLSSGEIGLEALTGSLSLGSSEVTLPGWNLESRVGEEIDQAIARLGSVGGLLDKLTGGKVDNLQDEAGKIAGGADEVLQRLDLAIDFNSMPWKLNRVAFDGGSFEAGGQGTFSPADGKVDLNLVARFTPEKTQELVAEYDVLKGLVERDGRLAIPMLIEGPMTAPAVGVDVKGAASGLLGLGGDGDDDEKPEKKLEGLLKGLLKKK